jgi:hypothetical protein
LLFYDKCQMFSIIIRACNLVVHGVLAEGDDTFHLGCQAKAMKWGWDDPGEPATGVAVKKVKQ